MKIYCYSGLGADERVFRYIDLSPHQVIHVKWISPVKNESLKSYAQRMGEVIDSREPFALVGLSFGGMLVQELAKTMNPHKTIVISSIAGKHEKPFRMRMMRLLKLYNLIPSSYFNRPSKIAFRLFGVNTENEKEILSTILNESDPQYIRWALNAIADWDNTERVSAYRIHGSNDKLFSIKNVQPDYTVSGGGHFMVVSHSKEIEQEILKVIGS